MLAAGFGQFAARGTDIAVACINQGQIVPGLVPEVIGFGGLGLDSCPEVGGPAVVTVGPLAAGQVSTIAPFVYLKLGSVSGIVVDQQGQRLPNVFVAATDGGANFYSITTDANGAFSLPAAPGTNTVLAINCGVAPSG